MVVCGSWRYSSSHPLEPCCSCSKSSMRATFSNSLFSASSSCCFVAPATSHRLRISEFFSSTNLSTVASPYFARSARSAVLASAYLSSVPHSDATGYSWPKSAWEGINGCCSPAAAHSANRLLVCSGAAAWPRSCTGYSGPRLLGEGSKSRANH